MTKRFGFTLAEVLITLGIIGVVAAMTIPTLISNTNGAQFKTAYKKALSTLNQAVIMNIAIDDTDFSTIAADDADTGTKLSDILGERMQSATEISPSYVAEDATAPTLTENDAAPMLDYTIQCVPKTDGSGYQPPQATGGGQGTGTGGAISCSSDGIAAMKKSISTTIGDYRKYSFADGTAFWYNVNAEKCTDTEAVFNNCYGFIDVNGATGPNKVIYCAEADEGQCDSSEITDIYPVIFHGQTVEPATASARAVLFGK